MLKDTSLGPITSPFYYQVNSSEQWGKRTRLEETQWALIICGVSPKSVWQKTEKVGAANL